MRASWFLALWLTAAGCTCTSLTSTSRFTCSEDAECRDGFVCLDVGDGPECVVAGTQPVVRGSDGGVDAGVDGGVDAGFDGGAPGDAGDDAGVDAGDDAGVDGGGDAGFDGGTLRDPSALVFTTPAQVLAPGACSSVLVLETRDDAGVPTPVRATTPVDLSASGADGGVEFFTTSTCANATTQLSVAAGTNAALLYVRGVDPGTYQLEARAAGLTPASQTLRVVAPPDALVFVNPPAGPVRGGECVPVTLEARRGGQAVQVIAAQTIGLSVLPVGAAVFATDPSCDTLSTTASLQAGQSSTTVYVKPRSGVTQTFTATASFGADSFSMPVTPMVRQFRCDFGPRVVGPDGGLPDGGSGDVTTFSRTCTFSPPVSDLGSTIMWQQATSSVTTSTGEYGTGLVRCHLANTSQVQCLRRHDRDPAQVLIQLAEVPLGVQVQRVTNSSSTTSCSSTTLSTSSDPAHSFVLQAANYTASSFDDDEAQVFTLTSPTTISVVPGLCQGYSLQVVEWLGVDVVRGVLDGGLLAGEASRTVQVASAGSTASVVLGQAATTVNAARTVCDMLVRTSIDAPNRVAFSRTAGDAGCPKLRLEQVAYERIDFNDEARVNAYDVVFGVGEAEKTVVVAPVDTTRTVVFASTQQAGGQGNGETEWTNSSNHGVAAARFLLDSTTTVKVTRAESSAGARFTFYVVELTP